VPYRATGSDDEPVGSNNWAVGRGRTSSGAGVLGSDPHQPFALPSNRYECRLHGPEDDSLGAAWVGAPGLVFGRNRRIAWGLTNSNASVRDLYREEVHPSDDHSYRDNGGWQPFAERDVAIAVRGAPAHRLSLRTTRRGPIVNHLLPASAIENVPPLSLRWVGQEHIDDMRAMLALSRAQNWEHYRLPLQDWALPVYNFGYADVEGHVGYQFAARVPLRRRLVYGFREANNPLDQWDGAIPFAALPSQYDPAPGFIASANNAPVDDDYPYHLYGAFASGARATRIREMLTSNRAFDGVACAALQNDTLSLRARRLVPHLLRRLASSDDADIRTFTAHLAGWDYRYELSATAPVLFEQFFQLWKRRVVEERFPARLHSVIQDPSGVAARLVEADDLPWFGGEKTSALVQCAQRAIASVREAFGPDPAGWAWGALHRVHFRHPLSTPASADVFDVGPRAVTGAGDTVRNTGAGGSPPVAADTGAEYRLVADMSVAAGALSTQCLGQSGQPGSPFYADQFADWVEGRYHTLLFDLGAVEAEQSARLRIEPRHPL
ncbi:MAG TPA: penicillin acylase family protein, partial [Chloroflexota bacterium]